MGCKDSLNLNAAILRDIQNSLNMSYALFPPEEQIKEYWRSMGVENKKGKEDTE